MGSPYKPRHFDLCGLRGISDQTLEMHFAIYEEHVAATNLLGEVLAEVARRRDSALLASYAEVKRRLAFEYNSMTLHEYYFDNLRRDGGGEPGSRSAFRTLVQESFGTFEAWRMDFMSVGRTCGSGWSATYLDVGSGRISNHWVEVHDSPRRGSLKPLLVMDAWEHAYLLDHTPTERPRYIEAFFANVDWTAVEARIWPCALAGAESVARVAG